MKTKFLKIPFLFVFGLLLQSSCQHAPPPPSGAKPPELIRAEIHRKDFQESKAQGEKYAVSTQGRAATQAAKDMFKAGGNVIDAFVAASFAISVERPHSTGLGGGGFLVFHDAATGKNHAVDFRERAPLKARKNMFLDKNGNVDTDLSINSILSAGVPGLVAGLYEIHQKHGSLPWAKTIQPAIQLAESGFPVYPSLATALKERADVLARDPSARAIFLDAKGEPLPEGHVLVQKDLARTLALIARNGPKGFYEGPVRKSLLELSRRHKGIFTAQDFDHIRVVWREPLVGSFKGHKIVTMPPPSSGGVHVLQFLNFMEPEDLSVLKPQSPEAVHLGASALQMAFADRARYLGDPDFVKVPVSSLISKNYMAKRRREVSRASARRSDEVRAGEVHESPETTHLSIMDDKGNAVSSTQTINGYMGSGIVIPGTGVVLNNEMDDFSAKPGASNLFGAIGSEANAIAPMKTPLSSMSPTLVFKDKDVIMAVGAPGGTRIISCVSETVFNYIGFGLSLDDSVNSIRYHHQWMPDVLKIDPPGPRPETTEALMKMGYDLKIEPVGCYVMAVAKKGNRLEAVADGRDIGTAAAQ